MKFSMHRNLPRNFFCLLFFVFSYSSYATIDKDKESRLRKKANEYTNSRQQPGFEENKGQVTDDHGNKVENVLYKTSAQGTDIYITTKGITYIFVKEEEERKKDKKGNFEVEENPKVQWCRMDMNLSGANIKKENIASFYPKENYTNYFLGHCPEGILNVKKYDRLVIKDIYPGIDLVLNSNGERGLVYDFIVHPGSDANQIKLNYEGARSIKLSENGTKLKVTTSFGEITEGLLKSYEQKTGKQIKSFFKINRNQVDFVLADYDHNETLVIDPPLVWSTYYGGLSNDGPQDIICDAAGNLFVTGYLYVFGFPTLDPANGAYYQGANQGSLDAFILKFDPAGVLLWATIYGGNQADVPKGLALDATSLYVTGYTGSTNFPLQVAAGAYNQPTLQGGVWDEAFILKFDLNGFRQWATYFGGTDKDQANGIALDASANLYVTGSTASTDFPVTAGGFQTTLGGGTKDVFVARFNSSGALNWCTYYGGSSYNEGFDITVDIISGDIILTGYACANFPLIVSAGAYNQTFGGGGGLSGDVFILRLTSAGVPVWCTYYGGAAKDHGQTVLINSGYIYIVGYTTSLNFPLKTLAGAYNQSPVGGSEDFFILKFDMTGARQWATYFGGSSTEAPDIAGGGSGEGVGKFIVADAAGNIYITGGTQSSNLPILFSPGFNQSVYGGSGQRDIFIARFNTAGALTWSTYFGTATDEYSRGICLDPSGSIYLTGESKSFPVTILQDQGSGAYYQATESSEDGNIIKFSSACVSPSITVTGPTTVCAGNSITLSADGSDTYLWNTGETTAAITISPVSTITYTVIGTTGSCSVTAVVTITVISLPTITVNSPTICNGETATISANGGITYVWSIGFTSNPLIVNPTVTTSYTVTGTIGGCSNSAVATVTVNPLPILTFTITDANCNQNDGVVVASGIGGTSPYTYSWSTGITLTTISNLFSGTYSVTVTDVNGCNSTGVATVGNQTGFSARLVSTTSVTCYGLCNGVATGAGSGGTQPYTFLWSTQASTATISGLCANTSYTLTVTDFAGCTSSISVVVSQPSQLALNVITTSVNCNGASTGSATANVSGGTSAYNYLWSNLTITAGISNLMAGIYSVTVTDANGCTQKIATTIVEPPAITLTLTSTNTNCNQTDGSVMATSSGGTGTFVYLWSNGKIGTTISGFASGVYTVTVTDANSCMLTKTVTVLSSIALNAVLTQTNVMCNGQCTGTALVALTGGTQPYFYLWTGGQTTSLISALCAGNYLLIATDNKGCTVLQTVTITEPNAISIAINSNPDTIRKGESTTLTATGGGKYRWTPSASLSCSSCANTVATPTLTTTYCVVVTDGNSCSDSACITITVELSCGTIFIPNAFSPNDDGENDVLSIMGNCIKVLDFTIYDRWGEKVFETKDVFNGWDGSYKHKPLSSGMFVYYMEAVLSNGEKINKRGNITLVK